MERQVLKMKKKLGILGCAFLAFILLALSVQAGALSPAIGILQEDCAVIKTGVGKNTVTFSEEDFGVVFGESEFLGIVITELPSLSDGVLKLGALDVREGQIVAKNALKALRFLPAEAGKTASFGFKPYGRTYENDFVCTVYMLDSLNFAPTSSAGVLFAVEEIPVYASLSAVDPEGDELTYFLESAPEKGILKLNRDGSYCYTANKGAIGKDRFTYVAVDPYGNRSAPAEVIVNTQRNESGIVYTDMQDAREAHSAVLLAAKDAFVGEKIGDHWYFYPEKTVTRGEFLVMAMKMNDIDINLLASDESGFADSADFSPSENKYIATAARLGIVFGIDTEEGRCFCPDAAITSAQASTMITRIARLKGSALANAILASVDIDEEVSEEGMAMLYEAGLVASEDRSAKITRADAAELLYQLSLEGNHA